ncbi:hypothetical protein ACEPAF_6956 [Sanghuangporus sanghuang]
MHLLSLTVLLSYFVLSSHAFTFYFTSTPTQCANMTVEWTGGRAPFTLLLVPVGHLNPETRTIIQKDVSSVTFVSFVLDFPAQSQFVAVLNDASGVGAGGTSAITTVASSSDSSCLSTTQSHPKFFLFLPDDIGQCEPVDISWGSEAEEPVDILGLIPGGESFEIAHVTNNTSTSLQWTADLHSGTQIMFVAGDRDGLGTGGSSDVMNISEGNDDSCINDTSPSSTSGPAAGGVSSVTQDQGGKPTSGSDGGAGTNANGGSIPITTADNVGSTVTIGGTITTDGSGSTYTVIGSTGPVITTDNSGSTTTMAGPAGPITTTDNTGSTVTIGDGGSTGGSFPGSSNSGFPGSGGGTVTGPINNNDENGRHSNLALILGLVFGLLGLGLSISGIILYRRRRRRSAPYRNLESGRSAARRPHPWVTALTRGAHIRGGAGSSVDTLPSMYQTEPFILPSEHEPYIIPPQEPPPAQRQRPSLAVRTSSMQNLLGHGPFSRDAFGGTLAGMHGPDRKESVGPHGRPPSRTPSGRVTTRGGSLPPPSASDPPTRVTRDSEDVSPEAEEMSPNPFDDDVIEIPPTYTSVRRASGSNDREPWQPTRAQLSRSNASRHSRRSMLSDIASASHTQEG